MRRKPIEIFKSISEVYEVGQFYQHLLFLDHWFIRYELHDELLYSDEEKTKECAALCTQCVENNEALIQLCNIPFETKLTTRNIVELNIIHELLHLKFQLLDNTILENNDVAELYNHQNIEQLAKTILMARYNLNYDYFSY